MGDSSKIPQPTSHMTEQEQAQLQITHHRSDALEKLTLS
jgi:hypothetical protein